MVVLRQVVGDELRRRRMDQGRTLRDVSTAARVSLGYLSEVERGQKEASSELLASICDALEVPLSPVLHRVSQRVAVAEGLAGRLRENRAVQDVRVPDTVPDELEATVRNSGQLSAA